MLQRKTTPNEVTKNQKTSIDGATKVKERQVQKVKRDTNNTRQTAWYQQGLGCRLRTEGGGGGYEVDRFRQREGGNLIRENP